MASTSSRRITRVSYSFHFTWSRAKYQELKELMNEPLENVTVIPDETNTQKWTVEIRGPVSLFTGRRPTAISPVISVK